MQEEREAPEAPAFILRWRVYLAGAALVTFGLHACMLLETVWFTRLGGARPHMAVLFAVYGVSAASFWMLSPLLLVLVRRFPIERGSRLKRAPVHLAAFALCYLACNTMGFLLYAGLFSSIARLVSSAGGSAFVAILRRGPPSVMAATFFFADAVLHAIRNSAQARVRGERERQATYDRLELENQLDLARRETLGRQLEAHFLFNTLNIIASLAETNPAQSRELIVALTEMLREVLRHDAEQLVPFHVEWAFIERYLAIQQVRLAERMRVQISISAAAMEVPVPFLCLHPLVENAIEYGIAGRAAGGTVSIDACVSDSSLRVRLRNATAGAAPSKRAGFGLGLRVTHQRLRYFYGDRYRLARELSADATTETTLEIPVSTP